MKTKFLYFGIACWLALLPACKKGFLDQRPNKALLVPSTVADLRALLDNTLVFNTTPGLTLVADGDFYTTNTAYQSFSLDMERNSYTWAKDIFAAVPAPDWNIPYQQIFYANVVLEGVSKLAADTSAERRAVQGTALFSRAYALFNLAQEFAAPYTAATANSAPGVPVRLSSDVNLHIQRGNVQQAYNQVIADLNAARSLLPATTAYKSRPTAAAAQALLARVSLSMGNYPLAARYADSVLAGNPPLIDYNTLNAASTRPFPRALPDGNDEVLYYSVLVSYSFNSSAAQTFIDSGLYRSYDVNDLRKGLFYRELTPGNFKFKGNYAGTLQLFSGLATDELYLISAECRARAGKAQAALDRLNTLLAKRWRSETFVPLVAADAPAALRLVLTERRKELPARNLRWSDLRRLNTDPAFAVTLDRTILGGVYSLAPGSKRYVFPIPDEEIRLEGLQQNER
ncbi:MAG: RagB/SusD family nutrient uptake outer membrane protein [Bacteroidota bacterium]|nr:RagB/SusD family nutrient uptake outer membrane protein [Bacteroidota bacterium]